MVASTQRGRRITRHPGEADALQRATSFAQISALHVQDTGEGDLVAIILRDDDAASGAAEAEDQLVSRPPCGTLPVAMLIFAENRFRAEAEIARSSRDDAQAIAARLMTPAEKSDGRQSGRIGYHAAFDRRAFQPCCRSRVA